MFKKFTILFAVIFLTGVLYSQNSNYTRLPKHLQYKDETVKDFRFSFYKNANEIPAPFLLVPSNAVPGMVGFSDYATNGNTLNMIVSKGDTVVVSMVYLDSAEAQNANGGNSVRIAYNYSVNNASAWESPDRFDLTATKKQMA